MKKRLFLLLASIIVSGLCLQATVVAAQPVAVAQNAPVDSATILVRADIAIANPALVSYRGWLKYLEFRYRFDEQRLGAASPEAQAALAKLDEWTTKIKTDPDILSKLRGPQEWAYESAADGSGQPFKINIPTDYAPAVPEPLMVYAHGYSGNHMEHSAGMAAHAGYFEAAVLGRARGGQYLCLSEADVLGVVRYIKAHWNIDADRTNLSGGSMGGFATYWIGSRHPDLWASARPSCGYAFRACANNLLTVPVYSLHSRDDPRVPIVLSHGFLAELRELGGSVINEEPTGFGHAVWDFADGNRRSGEWVLHQVRPAAKDVRKLDFSAMDGTCARDWWAEVVQWGGEQRPARFILNAGADNTLYATLDNVTALRLDLEHSPVDRNRDLHVSVDGAVAFTVPAPLPEKIDLACGAKGWETRAPCAPPPYRLHTPGGASMVYDGSPILIVYGTLGDKLENAAMRTAAKAASTSPNPTWQTGDRDRAPQDGVSHMCNLYGNLPLKADRDVTDEDIQTCNLVILGTADQNCLISRIAEQLPVKLASGRIVCSDGERYPAAGNALGLTCRNPLAPGKLILWLASPDAAFYRPGAVLPQELFDNGYGLDLLVMSVKSNAVVAARSFDSLWNWSGDHAVTLLLPSEACTTEGWAQIVASSLREAANADFGIGACPYEEGNFLPFHGLCATPGLTRYGDMALVYSGDPVYVVEMTGAELLALVKMRDADPEKTFVISANFRAEMIDPSRDYAVALIDEGVWAVRKLGFILPDRSHATDVNAADAILRAQSNEAAPFQYD